MDETRVTDLERWENPSDHVALYSRADLESAKNRGQLIGWIQGGGAVVLAGIVLQVLGWIPMLLVVAGVGYVLYKLLSGKKSD